MSIPPLSHDHFDAVLFDLDGVLTNSAALHARSWKRLFDDFLHKHDGDGFHPFDADLDYRRFIDGKPRYDGIRSFLASREISLPEGEPDDPDTAPTVLGLGKRKNGFFLTALAENGIATFPAAIDFLIKVRATGFKTALVSSSRNARVIIGKLGLADKFDGWIDGEDVLTKDLSGKPSPDMFLAAAAALGIKPARAVVVEDAIAGIKAGMRGKFGLVIGVDRTHHPEALAEAGAHLVVSKLSDVTVAPRDTRLVDGVMIDKRKPTLHE